MFIMRNYQIEAINKARESFAKGNKRICLSLATGAGKSPIAREIITKFREKNKTGRVAYFTFRNVLINQMKETLKGLDVEIGTLQKHGKNETDLYDLVLIDEVHYASESKLQNNIKSKYILGLSATPIDSYGNTLDFDEIIDIVQLPDLIKLGYASPVKVLSTSKVDTSSLKTVGGDFNQKQAYELMSKSTIKKDIVDVYKKYALGLRTIIYCVNIQHAEELKKEFIEAGINCDSVHSKKADTEKVLKDFKDNKINLLLNCDMLTTGVDLPDIYCLILASPTKSTIKAVQIYGRATRLNPLDPNKEALIIDCANVIMNTQHPLDKLDFNKKKQDKNKMCKCGLKYKLINRQTKPLSDTEYVVISDYKCDCGNTETVENIKIVNVSICEGCGEIFESVGGLQIESKKDSINFDLQCKCCGHKRKFREILLTNDELKEIEYNSAFKSDKWNDIMIILKAEVKKCGYKWQYSERLFDRLQNTCSSPTEAIDKIKFVMKSGKKISQLMYI